MSFLVSKKLLGNISNQRIIRVRIGEQGADGKEDFGDGESRGPLLFEDVEADLAVAVDVAMVNTSFEGDFGCFERVVIWEMDV